MKYKEVILRYKLVIFGADGTLTPPRDGSCGPFSFELLPGVREKCDALRNAGVTLAIASNQRLSRSVWSIKEQMAWTAGALGISPYPNASFKCTQKMRKPHPYMLRKAMLLAMAMS